MALHSALVAANLETGKGETWHVANQQRSGIDSNLVVKLCAVTLDKAEPCLTSRVMHSLNIHTLTRQHMNAVEAVCCLELLAAE